ncbi:MAG: hypothetical protein AB1796_13560 [Bacillota bacterium]
MSAELENKMNKLLNNLRQNRFKLEQLLTTLQLQQQTLMEGLQKLMDEQLILQEGITGNLSGFEEKAGASQGLQGLFHGNPLLKQEIMQKRVAMEQNVQKMREQSFALQQKIQMVGKSIQDVAQYISPEILQEERYAEEILEDLGKHRGAALVLTQE